ncbi:hypothetical protein PRIPAC_92126, partial [Pristionchus pacificus]
AGFCLVPSSFFAPSAVPHYRSPSIDRYLPIVSSSHLSSIDYSIDQLHTSYEQCCKCSSYYSLLSINAV